MRYVTANKYIKKFWKRTIAGDASLRCVITTLFSIITLTLQIMLINVIYLDISVSNIPITMDYSVFACSQSEPVLQYNTGSNWLGAYTEWSLQGFQMHCSIV